MPSVAGRLSEAEIDDLVAYLRNLRGAADAHPEIAHEQEPNSFADSAAWMNRANRDSQEMPDTLLDNLNLRSGWTIADVGAGTGYFTWRLAQRVGPSGKVIAVEIRPEMLDLTAQEAKDHHLLNVEPVLGTKSDPRLAAGSVDLAFVANSYHEFSEPRAMMTAIRQALKPQGRLVVIEYAKEDEDDDPTAGVVTMSARQLRSEIESFGFKLERLLDLLPSQHVMIFSREP
jgi:ubiquinone/menaquinone biosynthesis C-methylase UbiE